MHNVHSELYVPYCLAVTPYSLICPPPPPPISWQTSCIGLFYLHYMPPPPTPRAAQAGLRYCSSCTRVACVIEELHSCIKCIENRLRTGLGLFHWPWMVSWGRWFCTSSCCVVTRPVGGVWLRDYLLCFAEDGNMYLANNSSILQYCHGMSISSRLLPHNVNRASLISAHEYVGGGLKGAMTWHTRIAIMHDFTPSF